MPEQRIVLRNCGVIDPKRMATYLERDLRQLIQIKNLSQFETFLRLLAGRVGQLKTGHEAVAWVCGEGDHASSFRPGSGRGLRD